MVMGKRLARRFPIHTLNARHRILLLPSGVGRVGCGPVVFGGGAGYNTKMHPVEFWFHGVPLVL